MVDNPFYLYPCAEESVSITDATRGKKSQTLYFFDIALYLRYTALHFHHIALYFYHITLYFLRIVRHLLHNNVRFVNAWWASL